MHIQLCSGCVVGGVPSCHALDLAHGGLLLGDDHVASRQPPVGAAPGRWAAKGQLPSAYTTLAWFALLDCDRGAFGVRRTRARKPVTLRASGVDPCCVVRSASRR